MEYKELKYLNGDAFASLIISGASKLKENVKKINDLNVFPIPDGDTGDNMYHTLSGGIESMRKCDSHSLSDKACALSSGMLFNARGNSGVILSQLFSGIALGFKGLEEASIRDIYHAFNEGVKKGYDAVVPPVEGTILTVARETTEGLINRLYDIKNLNDLSKELISIMYKSLENTPNKLAILKESGVIDSGGAGLYLIAEGVVDAVNGNFHDLDGDMIVNKQKDLDFSKFTEDSELKFGYCTEVLLRLMNKKVNVKEFDEKIIIDYLNTIGDSLVCIKDGSIVKIHVHTLKPQLVLDFTQKFGEFLTVKIENMTLQHNESSLAKNDTILPDVKRARQKFASVVVCDGEGVIELFKELGCDYIISGGQGNNPSINDFIKAYDEVNADNIYVFPNNSNIILAAKASVDIYKSSKIFVMESKNIGQAYASMAMLDYSLDSGDELYELFKDNLNDNTTVQVSVATRDVTLNNVDVKEGEYIAFIGKRIIASSKSIVDVILKGIDEAPDPSIVTLIFGKALDSKMQGLIKEEISEKYKSLEIYDIDGKQEVFDVIMVLE